MLADGRLHHAPPAPVRGPVVDTLGAGDAFIARLVVGLAVEEEPGAALAAAAEQAAATVSEFGAFGHGAPLVPVASTGRKLR